MILTAFMMAPGYHRDSWRLAESRVEELGYLDLITDLTLMCEAAKLDSIFFGDVATAETVLDGELNSSGLYEPLTALSALAGRTSHIGLSGTVSTTFSLPYVTARQLQSLDLLSGGRAGWNMVTSWIGAENFGMDQLPSPEDRYRQAHEFIDVAKGLWDSWSDDAVINDRANGQWIDNSKIRPINHEGEFFKVAGPMNTRRGPQGRPVLFQAGSSRIGMEFGAAHGDVIYTAQPWKQPAIAFRDEIREMAVGYGRSADSVKVLPGILPIVGESDAEAKDIARNLADHIDYRVGVTKLAKQFKLDLQGVDLDDLVPADRWSEDPDLGSRYHIFRQLGTEERFTVRQLIVELYRSGAHLTITGSASKIADQMIDWFDSGAADGFSLNPPFMSDGLRRICELLVPELRDRGYFREEYEGTTLRENLGLARPGAWDAR